MSLDEFLLWGAYSVTEPFGDDREDWRAAMAMALQANMNRPKGKPALSVQKFLPRFASRDKPKRSLKELEAIMYARYLAMGGKPKS